MGKKYINPDYTEEDLKEIEDLLIPIVNGKKVYSDGCIRYWLNSKLHREDGPAVEYPSGQKEWRIKGEFHRLDGPAVEYPSGQKEWYKNGRWHRDDGPAIERPHGRNEWYKNGIRFFPDGKHAYFDGTHWYKNNQLHREDGPAIIKKDGTEEWYLNGQKHRVGGPAVINKKAKYWESSEEWYIHGNLHRNASDGPAIISGDGKVMYFEKGMQLKKRKSVNQKLSEVDAEIKKLLERKQKLLNTNPAERAKEDLTPATSRQRRKIYKIGNVSKNAGKVQGAIKISAG